MQKTATHGLYCYEHSIEAKRHSQKMSEKRKQQRHERGLVPDYRKENKLCLWCGKPIEEENIKKGFLVCQYHRELFSEYSKKAENCPYRLATKADIAIIQEKRG